jgi:hypothetical protein
VGKKEFEQLFHKLRKDRSRIVIKKHAYLDYPERGFSPMEILELCSGPGRLMDNRAASAKPGSYIWSCKDEDDNGVELAVLIETLESTEAKEFLLVISAFRRMRG